MAGVRDEEVQRPHDVVGGQVGHYALRQLVSVVQTTLESAAVEYPHLSRLYLQSG